MTIRLGSTIALGISTAVYESVRQAQGPQGNPMVPFQRAFDVSIGIAGLAIFFLPFLRVGTQGNALQDKESEVSGPEQENAFTSDAETGFTVPLADNAAPVPPTAVYAASEKHRS